MSSEPPEVTQPEQVAQMLEELKAWLPAVYAEVMGKLPRTEDRRLTGRAVTRGDLAAYNARCVAAMALHPERCFCCACLHEATSR